jgi:hypothetical protein
VVDPWVAIYSRLVVSMRLNKTKTFKLQLRLGLTVALCGCVKTASGSLRIKR